MKNKVFNAVMLATPGPLNKTDLFIVWSCYILGNRKFLVGAKDSNLYFEVTYNGIKEEWYVDAYTKVNNKCIPDVVLTEYSNTNNNNACTH